MDLMIIEKQGTTVPNLIQENANDNNFRNRKR